MTDWKLERISDAVPTLKDLRLLSVHKQSFLLFGIRATQFSPSDTFARIKFGVPPYASMLNRGQTWAETL